MPEIAKNPVLLVHGIDDSGTVFRHLSDDLQDHGCKVHCLDLLPSNGDAALDELAEQIAAYVKANFAPSQNIDLVGFSMGGLVARYYVRGSAESSVSID